MSSQTSLDVEIVKELQATLKELFKTLEQEWLVVNNQWNSLRQGWEDDQFKKFEPRFNELSNTYRRSTQECEDYCSFLHQQIQIAERRKFKLGKLDNDAFPGFLSTFSHTSTGFIVDTGHVPLASKVAQSNYNFYPYIPEFHDQELLDFPFPNTGINIDPLTPRKYQSFITPLLNLKKNQFFVVPLLKEVRKVFEVVQLVTSLAGPNIIDIDHATLQEISKHRSYCYNQSLNEQDSLNSCLNSYLGTTLSITDRYNLSPAIARAMPLDEQLKAVYEEDRKKRKE